MGSFSLYWDRDLWEQSNGSSVPIYTDGVGYPVGTALKKTVVQFKLV